MHRFPKMDVANGSARVDILNSLLAKLCYAMSKGSHLFTREFTAHKIMSKGRKIPFDLGSSHILLLKHGKLARSILSKLALYSNPVFSRFPSKKIFYILCICMSVPSVRRRLMKVRLLSFWGNKTYFSSILLCRYTECWKARAWLLTLLRLIQQMVYCKVLSDGPYLYKSVILKK